MSIQGFHPFFDWVVFLLLSCVSCLYILEINCLSVTSFANVNISNHSEGFLFILFMVSFSMQKLLSLIGSFYFLFLFIFVLFLFLLLFLFLFLFLLLTEVSYFHFLF